MKTRVVHSKIWLDNWFSSLSKEGKVLFLYCITNAYISHTGFYELPDRVKMFETGLDKDELEEAKNEIQDKVRFYEDWVYVVNAVKYSEYKGPKNEAAKAKELLSVPLEIKNVLTKPKQHRVSIGYTYPIDTTKDQRSEIKDKRLNTVNDLYINIDLEKKEELPKHITDRIKKPNRSITTKHQDQAFSFAQKLEIDLTEAEKQEKGIKARWIATFKGKAKVNVAYAKCFDSSNFKSLDSRSKIYYFWKLTK